VSQWPCNIPALYMNGPAYIYPRCKCTSQQACNVLCYMRPGQHICNLTASVQANGHVIFLCYICASQHIYILTASIPANRHVIFCTTCILADIYVTLLQAYQPTGMNIPALHACQPTHICLQEHRLFLLHFCFQIIMYII